MNSENTMSECVIAKKEVPNSTELLNPLDRVHETISQITVTEKLRKNSFTMSNETSLSDTLITVSSTDTNVKNSLIVVSNHLPFVLEEATNGTMSRQASAGCLLRAIAPFVIESRGLWVGWPGMHLPVDFDDANLPESDASDLSAAAGLMSSQVMTVNCDPDLYKMYDTDCCNGTIWPFCHSIPSRSMSLADHWRAYVKVNRLFAVKTIEAIERAISINQNGEPPIVLVHDYHLMLCANFIREMGEEKHLDFKLTFFMHIPFPPWDTFRLFPWSDEILQGILACNMVGFQKRDYCINFVDCCERSLGCRVDRKNLLVEHGVRSVRVRPLPIGIPFEQFVQLANKARRVMECRYRYILSVDRLDSMKGLVNRLRAFEVLLERHPEYRVYVSFLQISAPSRINVPEYEPLKVEMDEIVERINERFSQGEWTPITCVYGHVNQLDLAAYYRDATVALVTPLYDSMNLVAKEFVACQIAEPSGVLIVSPFAGAGETMNEALVMNPYDVDEAVEVLHRALTMPEDERRMRMLRLRCRESENDVSHWMRSFMKVMSCESEQDDFGKTKLPPVTIDNFDDYLLEFVGKTHKLAVVLDYDVTVATPRYILESLSKIPDVHVTIISGHEISCIGNNITYASNHGLEIIFPNDTCQFLHPLGGLCKSLESSVCHDGAYVENNGSQIIYHYGDTPEELRQPMIEKARSLMEEYRMFKDQTDTTLVAGTTDRWSKGHALIYILKKTFGIDWSERVNIIYVGGDDVADEDAMMVLRGMTATFRVASSNIMKTKPEHRLPSSDSVVMMLEWIVRHFKNKKPSSAPTKLIRTKTKRYRHNKTETDGNLESLPNTTT